MSNPPLKVGIVGLQHLHPEFYLTLFKSCKEVKVVGVAEPDEKLRQHCCEKHLLKGYASLEAMLENETLDFVSLHLPHADFPKAAIQCAKKHIHLMVDKPIAADAKGGQSIVDAAKKYGVKTTTGYYFRINPVARQIKRVIKSGAIGKITDGEARFLALGFQRYIDGHAGWMIKKDISGGGPMRNLGCHWIDLFRYFAEDEAIGCNGMTTRYNPHDIEDVCMAQVMFRGGAILSVICSFTLPDASAKSKTDGGLFFSIQGTNGVINWRWGYEKDVDLLEVITSKRYIARRIRSQNSWEVLSHVGRAYVKAFAAAIRENKPMFVTAEDGVATLKIVDAIYKSAETRRFIKI